MNGEYINGDCLEYLAGYADNHFDLAICDPPYGANCNLKGGSSNSGKNGWSGKLAKANKWNIEPNKHYFNQLFRVSKNQIIWGANHFISKMPLNSSCWIFWDKGQRNFSLADGELAWTSFKKAVRVFDYSRAKLLHEGRIHPTQKPVSLYRWLLQNYAKPNDLILDTHVGSASSLIACEIEGFKYVGFEKDPEYYEMSMKRIKQHLSQKTLF